MSPNERILSVLGVVMYIAAGVLFLTGGLVVPEPWVFFLWAVWAVGWVVVVRVYRTSPKWTPLVAIALMLPLCADGGHSPVLAGQSPSQPSFRETARRDDDTSKV